MSSNNNSHRRGRPAHPDILTPAEWKVAEGVRHGLSNPEIARRQQVSPDAIKFHVSNILSKLGLKSRSELRLWQGISADSNLAQQAHCKDLTGIKSVGQISRSVKSVDDATNWYTNALGLEYLYSISGMAFFISGETRILLTKGNPENNSIVYFEVRDIHRSLAALAERGVEVLAAPHMVHKHEGGIEEWMAFIKDIDDQPLALMSRVENSTQQI